MGRRYTSALRQQRKDATGQAIVEAATRLLTAQVPDIQVPDVAAAAGVSVATIYRHFRSKDDLLDAVYDRWMQEARKMLEAAGSDRETLLALLPDVWRAQSADDDLERASSMFTAAGRSVRQRRLARRREIAAELVADVDTADETSRRFLQAIVLLLTSTTAHRHLRDHWDMSTAEAAEAAAWAVRGLVGSVR